MAEPIPVVLLTGFLGAGKTTLLNRLLRDPALAGAAVLVNEFGEIGLDHWLIEALDEDTVLLNAGCLCCSVRGDLVRALSGLAPRAPSAVVIETTGLADPEPILRTLLSDPFLATRYRLRRVVTVVDALHAGVSLSEQPEASRQAAAADVLVLSKTDLPEGATALPALRARLRRLNPAAPIVTTADVAADPAMLLAPSAVEAGGVEAASPDLDGWLGRLPAGAPGDHAHDHAHHHGHDPNRHDARIRAVCLEYDRKLHWLGVGTWLEMLVASHGEHLLRLKAVLDLVGEDRPLVLHGIRHLIHPPTLLPAWPPGAAPRSRIVLIVRDLDPALLAEGLRAFEDAASEA